MKSPVHPAVLALLSAPLLGACVGTTGGEVVDFSAYAAGPSDATGAPGTKHAYAFHSPYTGYDITLSTATLQIGAVYLDAAPCTGGSGVPSCVNESAQTVAQVSGGVAGAYGQAMSGVLLDALSPDPQPFASGGTGIVQPGAAARSAEVWLAVPDGTTDAIDDTGAGATVATIEGQAERGGQVYPFSATVTIGQNRAIPASNPALPGANPICQQRIVRPICLTPAIQPAATSLHVQVDPKAWFNNVDFSLLAEEGQSSHYTIPDDDDDVTGNNLFQGIESSTGVYSFSFQVQP
jgi:hypothetical protein